MRDHQLPTSPGFWRSPLRGPWLTSVLGMVLLVGITVLFVTGLLSYAAYNPDLRRRTTRRRTGAGSASTSSPGRPTPSWLYRLTQGVHVTLGIVLIPVLLAKLWSVLPKLFSWPPLRSPRHALERISLLLLVGGALFEFATGVLDVQLHYVFPGSFYPLHFYGAWVFIARLRRAHRVPLPWRAVRAHCARNCARPPRRTGPTHRARHARAPPRPPSRAAARSAWSAPARCCCWPTTAGQSIGGSLRATALLAPHGGREPGPGPNGFQINKTAAARGHPARGHRRRLAAASSAAAGRTVR